MSGIGIDLKVNSRQVMDAKQQIEMLNRSLNDTNALGDLTIGEDGLPLASQRIKEMSEQVRRLQALSRQGTSKGGVLDQKQFQEAQEHMKRLNGYIQDYAKNITRVKTEMQQLSAAQANLARTGQRGSEDFRSNSNRMRELQEERRNLEAQERHVRQYGAQGSSAADDISNMNQQQQAAQGMNLKKILGYGLAAAGGFSILGFLSQSRAKYQQSVGHEVTLGARGIKDGFNDNVNMGIGPLEQMQMLEHLSSSTGMSGQKAKDAAKMSGAFGRYAGVDPNQVAGMYGTMYQTTGKEDSANAIINLMGDAIKKGMDKAKTTELLTMVTRNTQLTAQAMGGAGIDDKQAMMATSMALEAIKAGQEGKGYSQFAKSAEMQNFMQNGMEFNGDPTGDIIKAQILGLDSSEMSWAKKQKIDELQKGGFTSDKGMLDRMMGVVKEATAFEGNSLEAQAGFIGNKIDPRLRGKPSRMLVEMYNDKKDGKNIFDRADAAAKGGAKLNEVDRKKIEEWEAASGSSEMDKLAREAKREQLHIDAGEKLNRILGGLEDAALGIGSSILGTQSAEKLVAGFEKIGTAVDGLAKFMENPAKNTAKAAFSGVIDAINYDGIDKPLIEKLTFGIIKGGKNKKQFSGEDTHRFKDQMAGFNNSVPTEAAPENLTPAPAPVPAYNARKTINEFVDRSKKRWGIGKHTQLAEDIASKKNMDPNLVKAVIKSESDGRSDAVSSAGAMGLMQVMPFHFKKGENPFDPTTNIERGTGFLQDMLIRYNGDKEKALAAYNAGPGAVDKRVKKHGSDWLKHMPKETQAYVPKTIAYSGGSDGGGSTQGMRYNQSVEQNGNMAIVSPQEPSQAHRGTIQTEDSAVAALAKILIEVQKITSQLYQPRAAAPMVSG